MVSLAPSVRDGKLSKFVDLVIPGQNLTRGEFRTRELPDRSLRVLEWPSRGLPSRRVGDRRLERDLRTLVRFVAVYCKKQHCGVAKSHPRLKTFNVAALAHEEIELCPNCMDLLTHALTKRAHCPMHPKPACKHCPSHCYHPKYRKQIQEVMRFSGKHILLTGRLDYLFRLLF